MEAQPTQAPLARQYDIATKLVVIVDTTPSTGKRTLGCPLDYYVLQQSDSNSEDYSVRRHCAEIRKDHSLIVVSCLAAERSSY